MLYNYHTHTYRCHHASGTERDYVRCAVDGGLKALGFSDHAPYIFDGDYYSTYRMRPEEASDYIGTIRSLADEYKDRITVLAGYEIEYYPALFSRTIRFLSDIGCDYLVMGQHFVGNEEKYAGRTSDYQVFDRYIQQIIEGLETGMFTYLCHPDLCLYTGDRNLLEKGFLQLCEAAKRMDIPLELNLYGLIDHRHYPSKDFFRIAKEVGNEIIAAYDAHDPNRMTDENEIIALNEFVADCGITLSELTVDRVLARKDRIR